MDQKLTASTEPKPKDPAGPAHRVRVVLVADAETLAYYQPVLQRMMLGLIDETEDLTLLCLGRCDLADFVPCPPVRLLTETRKEPTYERFDINSREAIIRAPRSRLINKLLPHRRVRRLTNALASYKPTLLHALGQEQGHLVRQLSKQLRIPYVVTYLGLEGEPGHVSSSRCGAVICCDSHAARQTRQSRKLVKARVHLIPIGTHVSQNCCCFNHDQSISNLIYVGPLEERLGLAELLNALRRLLNKGHLCHVTLCGKGNSESHLRQQAERLGMNEQVHFMPPPEVFLRHSHAGKLVIKAGDIFVQTWKSKTLRPEWLDAMSVGAAMVVTAQQKCDLFVDNQTAAMVPFKNEDKLFETLDKLLTEKDYTIKLAIQSQEYLRKHFQTSSMVTRLGRVYRQTLSEFASLKEITAAPPQELPQEPEKTTV